MSNIHQAFLVTYLFLVSCFLLNWLNFCQRHPYYHPEENWLYFVIFMLVTIFSPVIILLRCQEILISKKIELDTVFPVFLAMFVFGSSLYLSWLNIANLGLAFALMLAARLVKIKPTA